MYKSLKIDKESVILFLLVFPFIPIDSINYGIMETIYNLWLLFSVVYIFIKYYSAINKKNIPVIFILLFGIALCVSCVINENEIVSGFYYAGKIVSFILLNIYYLDKKSLKLLKIERDYLTIIIIINFAFQIINQNYFGIMEISGNYKNFFQSDNVLGFYYVAYISLLFLFEKEKKISIKSLIMITICVLSTIRAWSATALVGIAMIIFYILFIYEKEISKFFTYKKIIIFYVISFIAVIVYNIQNKFDPIIQLILRKEATFNGRQFIWGSAISNILASPFWGYGIVRGGRMLINLTRGGGYVGSHNMFLEVSIQSGFIGLIFFVGFLLTVLYSKTTNKTEALLKKYYMFLFFSFVMLIMYLTSHSIYEVYAYLPLLLCYKSDIIFMIQNNQKDNNLKQLNRNNDNIRNIYE